MLSQDLAAQFLRMYPLKDICWKDIQQCISSLGYEEAQTAQQHILSQTVLHPYAQQFPPTSSYKRLFLKTLISHIEEANVEVSEILYEEYMRLLSDSASPADGFCYRTYNVSSVELPTITLKETCSLISDGTTGMCTWEASHVLAKWCMEEKEKFHKKNVIELGAGLGLTGITVVHTCQPASYTFTDTHASVLKILTENIWNNQNANKPFANIITTPTPSDGWVEGSVFATKYGNTMVKVSRLDWADSMFNFDADVVLAADVVYDNEVTRHLVKLLKIIFSKIPTTDVYVASTLRNPDTYTFFKDLLASEDLHIKVEICRQYQDSPSQPQHSIAILHIVASTLP